MKYDDRIMMSSLKTLCISAMLAVTAFGIPVGTRALEVVIPVSRSELVEVPVAMGEVIVADPDVADVYAHGKNNVSIIGKSLGQTSVRIFDESSKMIRRIDVTVGYDLPAIRKAMKDFLPYEAIGVEMINTNLVLTGQISSLAAADTAVKIANEFIEPPFGKTASDNAKYNTNTRDTSPPLSEEKHVSKVLNLMTIASGQQVMLRVRVGEMRRTALKKLGVNLQAISAGTDSAIAAGTGGGIDAFVAGSGLGFGQFTIDGRGTESGSRGFLSGRLLNSSGNGVSALLEALERDGLFKVLAEPNLVAMSGEEAKFLAGGEFPIPVSVNEDRITIEFKPFGVSVRFKPTVITENRIRIDVEPEVSEISEENAIILTSIQIPALTTRRAKTTLEMAPGESFMIAGLIQDEMRSTISQLPGLGEIPILSALFRSTEYQREETELVLAVTPYLVDPLVSADVKLPTDEYQPASVMESFFYGALGSTSAETERLSQTPSLEGPIGFIVD